MTVNGLRRALLATSMISATFAATAVAAPAWLPAVDLSAPGQNATVPQVGLDGGANATAVWVRPDPDGHTLVQTAARPAGQGGWTLPAADLSGPDADLPQIAVNPAGAAVVVWKRFDGTDFVIEARRRDSGSVVWGPVTPLTTSDLAEGDPDLGIPDAGEADGPDVAIDDAGNALTTWDRNDGTNQLAEARAWPGAGAPGPVATLSDTDAPGQDASNSHPALDGAGNALAIWQQLDDVSGNLLVRVKARAAAGTWDANATDLTAAGVDGISPQISMNGAGFATAAWTTFDGTAFWVQSKSRPAGGSWSATAADLSTTDTDASGPQVGVDGAGRSIAVWSKLEAGGASSTVQAARRSPGAAGTWSGAVDISPAGAPLNPPSLAVGTGGDAVAAWGRTSLDLTQVIQSSNSIAGLSTWSAATDRSAGGQDADAPHVIVDAAGNAVAVWTRSNGSNTIIQSARLDATNPLVSAVNVPPAVNAGDPVQMSITADDLWSPLVAPTWNFGDGTTGTGSVAHHTYTAGGTFTVTVAQPDAAGNSASAQRTITVTVPVVPVTLTKLSSVCVKRPRKTCQPKVKLTLNQPATLRLTVRRGNGKLVGKFTRTGRLGPNTVVFPAKIGKTKLGKGAYRVTIVAATGSSTSPARTVRFTIR